MSRNFFAPWLIVTSAAIISVTLGTTASAEYNYPRPSYNQASYQQNSFNRLGNHQTYQQVDQRINQQHVFTPPVIMPYIPFDDGDDRPIMPQTQQQPVFIQPVQHYQSTQQQPQINRHQPKARTWRQTPAATNSAYLSKARQRVLQAARRQLGVRYRWGGNTPRQGFDCSGFTKHAMRDSNIKIPRTAAQQSRASHTINRSQLKPGDMIFFKTDGRRINHVGIYLGNGRFIHAASGGGKVATDDLRKAYWQKRLHKYGTFFNSI